MKKFVVVLEEIMQSEIVVYAADAEEAEEEAKFWYDRNDAVSSGLEVVESINNLRTDIQKCMARTKY